jgi:RHH-type proline utilization regulon transcriptional repressor/proline dehydrogenase/delta 1-pyrroline-5-carboxylate dehydrogenase
LSELQREVFGPILHVIRYRSEELPQLVDAINATGFGLTLGVHSRIDETIDYITSHAHVGNMYVNRNVVGAVVGVQPFGGEGSSGTGPKAGGPFYLKRLQRGEILVSPDPNTADHWRTGESISAAFGSLLAWARTHGFERTVELGQHYAQTTLLNATWVLPGPTGERNTLLFAPRGKAWCAAASVNGLLNQFAAVLATGNHVVVTAAASALIPEDLPQSVRHAIRYVDELDPADMNVVLVESGRTLSCLPALAAHDGALVPVIEICAEIAIPLWRLFTERAVCINTTAAGGNASLMTLPTA